MHLTVNMLLYRPKQLAIEFHPVSLSDRGLEDLRNLYAEVYIDVYREFFDIQDMLHIASFTRCSILRRLKNNARAKD